MVLYLSATTVLFLASLISSWGQMSGVARSAAAAALVIGVGTVTLITMTPAPLRKSMIGLTTGLAISAVVLTISGSINLTAYLICVQSAMFLAMHIGAFWSERNTGIWVTILATTMVAAAAVAPFDTPWVTYVLIALGIVGVAEIFGAFARRMRYSATHDALTGLLNRFGLESKVEQLLPTFAARGMAVSMAVLDLDNFKKINDQYGHIAGDILLARVSRAWRSQIGKGHILGRLGGDEFVLFMPGVPEADARELIDKLHRAHPAEWSMGLVCMPAVRRWGEIYRAADTELYRAKHARPNHPRPNDGRPNDARPDQGHSETRPSPNSNRSFQPDRTGRSDGGEPGRRLAR